MKRLCWVFTALLAAQLGRAAVGQEAGESVQGGPVAPVAGRLSGPIDFWGKGPGPAPRNPSVTPGLEVASGNVQVRETIWAQPIRTPDGNWMLYVPPKPILDFLESPSEETAKAYVAWKAEQAQKLGRAIALLGRVKGSGSALPKEEGSPKASDTPAGPATLIYFKKPSCTHCITQDGVLAEWLPKHPEVRLDVVFPEDRPELWKSYGVRGTPTLVFRSKDGKGEVLVGLHTDSQLEAALERLAMPARGPSSGEGKEGAR